MLKELIKKYGKEKINTLTKYPSILTLHKLGERGVLLDSHTTDIADEEMEASEKIDGTNVRIICFGSNHLIGSREFILHHNDDLYFDPSQGIVMGIKDIVEDIPVTEKLTVIYGEFFGGKSSANSKWYGKEKHGFRVFDVAIYDDLSILEKPLSEISKWRETVTEYGIEYGQNFLTRKEAQQFVPNFNFVPLVEFSFSDTSHESIMESLNKYLPSTNVALTDSATKKAEGVVLRNKSRTKIVKLRFEDYEKTLRNKQKA